MILKKHHNQSQETNEKVEKNIYISITGKGLSFVIYKEFVEISNKKITQQKNQKRI